MCPLHAFVVHGIFTEVGIVAQTSVVSQSAAEVVVDRPETPLSMLCVQLEACDNAMYLGRLAVGVLYPCAFQSFGIWSHVAGLCR